MLVCAGGGFYVWHNQPSFCNAICHEPMDYYVDGYYGEGDAAHAQLAVAHQQEGVTCLQCHEATLEAQINEGTAWVSGSFERNADGSLAPQLITADKQQCATAGCHDWNDVVAATLLVDDNRITCLETAQDGETQSVGGFEAVRDGTFAKMIEAAQGSDIDTVSGSDGTYREHNAAAFPANDATPIAPRAVPETWDYECDVCVVGAGGGGLNAAARAAELGADVICVEALGLHGGVDWQAEGGQWARFLYDGMTQLSRQPWLTIDRCGNRLRYMDSRVAEDGANAIYALGDLATIQMTPPGHRSYIIFDADYEDHLAGFAQEHCRKLITPDLEQIDKVPEHYRDWHHGVQDAIDADVLKRRDTLEELEADLGFAPGVLTSAVAKWNECCERGEDDFMYPMPPEWLHAIVKPPFYGCRIGGNLYGTKAGLLINDQMQVVGTNGLVIPGLYAGWHTAGGACGENSYIGDPILGSLMGDVGLAFCGGYLCGTSAVEHELQGAK